MVVNFASVKRPYCTIWATLKSGIFLGISAIGGQIGRAKMRVFGRFGYLPQAEKFDGGGEGRISLKFLRQSPRGEGEMVNGKWLMAAKARQDAG